MKKIYIDVTNIPELEHFTGVSRVVTEVLIRLVRAGSDVSACASTTLGASMISHRDRYCVLCLNGSQSKTMEMVSSNSASSSSNLGLSFRENNAVKFCTPSSLPSAVRMI